MTYIDIYNSMIKKADFVPTNYMQYIVKKGDNPWTINRNYGLKQGTIQSLNKGVNFKVLRPGTKLRLPTSPMNNTSKTNVQPVKDGIYSILKGDNPWSLNKKFNIPQGTIQKLNPKTNFKKLQIGQKINIPNKKQMQKLKIPAGYGTFYPDEYTWYGSVMQQSSLNPKAIGDDGKAYGIVQVRQKAIDDVNRVFGTKYTLNDALDKAKSKDIFRKYLAYWGKQHYIKTRKYPTPELHWKQWNGGPTGNSKEKTEQYVKNIKNKYLQWNKFKWSNSERKKVKEAIKLYKLKYNIK